MSSLKDLFMLDPDVIFLNHGSFGATPIQVLNVYQDWQRQLERQPVEFFIDKYPKLDRQARQTLGNYINVDPDDVTFVTNATTAINIIARSLCLGDGDEILATNHEYGACDKIWTFTCKKTGANYKRVPIQLPLLSQAEIEEHVWEYVTPRTRVIFMSHITSPTAQQMSVKEIAKRARREGILCVIDGAHAPGQIPVDLQDIDPDFYAGNLHKWALCPKGAGFLFCRKDIQHMIEPLVVSWGWEASPAITSGSAYIDSMLWQGTRDPSACLSVSSAIDFQLEHDWPFIRKNCHDLLVEALQRINELTGLPSLYSSTSDFCQMAVTLLPNDIKTKLLKQRLLTEFRVEVPIIEWEQVKLMRISIQGYNLSSDIDKLVKALDVLLPQVKSS